MCTALPIIIIVHTYSLRSAEEVESRGDDHRGAVVLAVGPTEESVEVNLGERTVIGLPNRLLGVRTEGGAC